jgi:hypothetical protein
VGGGNFAAAFEYVRAHVAAQLGPLVGLVRSTAPIRRRIASRSGKIPTTSVRRRISLFSRSCGLFDQALGCGA